MKNNIIFSCLLSLFTTAALAQNNISDPTNFINNKIQNFMNNKQVPGVAVALYYNNHLYFFNYGYANTDTQTKITENTIFEIASITKVFTATLLAQEVLQNKVNLNDPVVKYLPAKVKKTGESIDQVSLLDLATHTAALPKVAPAYADNSTQAFLQYFNTWQPTYPIGKKFLYSNIGFGLLGYAVAGAAGTNYENLLQSNILDPLKMTSSSMYTAVDNSRYAQGYNRMGRPAQRWPRYPWGAAGALRSSSSDMAKFLLANLGLNAPADLIQAMQFAQKAQRPATPNFQMGLGWQVFYNGLINKNGGSNGFGTAIAFYPAKKIGVVILTNKAGSQPILVANNIVKELAQITNSNTQDDNQAGEL